MDPDPEERTLLAFLACKHTPRGGWGWRKCTHMYKSHAANTTHASMHTQKKQRKCLAVNTAPKLPLLTLVVQSVNENN